MFRNRKSRRSGQTQVKRFVSRPSIEAFEKRELLTTIPSFIQGTAFVDPTGTGVLTNTDTPLAGATISLYNGSAFISSTTSGSDGGYVFSGLTVGTTYTLVESPPTGYSNSGAQALSSIDPATVTAPNTIQVTAVNPTAVVADFVGPVSYGSTGFDRVSYTLNGASDTIVPTQLTISLSGGGANTASFPSLCVGINDRLSIGGSFANVIDSQAALPNGGEIAYLYNQYGATLPSAPSLPTAIQSFPSKDLVAGVQVAIWELEYGSSFALTGYDSNYTSSQDYADIQAAAAAFVSDASGKSEKLAVIDASLTGTLPAPAVAGQSVLASESFNFGNIPNATPAINTTQQPATATVGSSIADKATVTGGYNPTGTVTFSLYNNSAGTGTPLFTDTETLAGGSATSKGYIATAAATDYWVATYNGDTNNTSVTSGTASEPVSVTKAGPAINTTQQPATATVGSSIADKATVTGGYNPTGTVTFSLYNNSAGTGTPLFTDTETLAGGSATSKGYIATAAATDYWVATYNGDTNNTSVTSGTASEPVSVTKAGPAINTTQQPATATVGSSIADKATVTGGYNPTGTVTFSLYNNSAGTGTPLFTDTETLAGGSATSKGYIATAAATDYWVATYNGDTNNTSVTSGTASEPVSVTKAGPAINTTQQPATATVGSSIADKATVTGGYNPTGTVTFSLYNNSAGTGTPLFTDTETLAGGSATSKGYIATAAATDYWLATYNGDSNNGTATSPAASEPVSVTKAGPAINTQQLPASATVGSSIADKATVTGGYNPTGTVTFSLYNNSAGTGTPLFTDTETLAGGSATSVGYTATATATDYWLATYNGDSNNGTATSPAASEPVSVTKATPTINTQQLPATATVGSSIADKATVTGGYNPTGTVTFSLYNNSAGTGTPLFTDTETLAGGSATSVGYTATATATDYWLATYNGDSNNGTATSPAASEPVSVTKATPTINTQQLPATATVGSSIADKATVTGGYNPTGTVTFSLYNNSAGTGTPLFTDTETLAGGSATSKGYIATAIATDYWLATYNGDSNNGKATSPAASEPVSIVPNTSISGTKYLDATGNGLSCTNGPLSGDTPAAGITIDLFTYVGSTLTLVGTTVTASDGTYSFTGLPYGTYYVAESLPSGQVQTGPIQTASTCTSPLSDCGFQSCSVNSGCFSYTPSGPDWTFSGQSGISGNNSAFTSGNPCAPQGSDVAFVQCQGSFSQDVSNWSAGSYELSFSAAQRANNGGSNEDFQILVDGNVVATCQPTGTSYQNYTTPSFYVGSGSHCITFKGLDSCGGDNTSFIDNVCVTQNSGTVTEQSNGQAYYTITLASCTPTSTNNNFSDYVECNTSAITNVSYKDNNCGPYSTLAGHTSQGDTVSATFTVTGSTNQMVTLVSYAVPYSGAPLSAQVEYSVDTGTFTPGTHTVSVTLPCGYYQVDFVCGAAITQFGATGNNVTYHGENRFISSDNGGCNTPSYNSTPLDNVQTDVGNVAAPGTLSYTNGSYTITADGNDIWNNTDAFTYTYQSLVGDGEIIAKVDSVSSSDAWAKAGLMIRQSLNPSSAQASVFATPGNGVDFQDRETTGASSNQIGQVGYCSSTSVYLKLVRMGNTITGYDSSNGVTWTQVGTDTVAMTGTVYVGLAVSSHAVNVTAKFDNVNTDGYYCGNAGQSLISNCGGWSGSTALSSWLASNYANLYGSNAGSCNLWGMNSNQVANFCQSLENQYGAESLECQTLNTALDLYFSNWSWGGSYGSSAGFNASWGGICSTMESTASGCSAFYGGTSISLWTMLSDINNQSSNGCEYANNTNYHQQAYGCVTWASACI